eukprot:IDg9320t1
MSSSLQTCGSIFAVVLAVTVSMPIQAIDSCAIRNGLCAMQCAQCAVRAAQSDIRDAQTAKRDDQFAVGLTYEYCCSTNGDGFVQWDRVAFEDYRDSAERY